MAYTSENFKEDMGVSRETAQRLQTHLDLLRTWAPRINLVGPHELDDYWRRHALDSAQLLKHAPNARRWIDLGAGAGFPGLVIACCLAGQDGADVALVEPNQKRVAFLREAIRATGAPARVIASRVEDIAPHPLAGEVAAKPSEGDSSDMRPLSLASLDSSPAGGGAAEAITARAFASLSRIIAHAKPWIDRGAVGLFLKGEDAEAELAEARKTWALKVDLLPSLSDPRGRIVRVEGAERVGPA